MTMMELKAGALVGHYELGELLGVGGMGAVYRARDRKLGRDVAIKVLPESVAGDPERIARFEREARVLASLNHPNIAAIYGFENIDGLRFLVLELVPGETPRRTCRQRRRRHRRGRSYLRSNRKRFEGGA